MAETGTRIDIPLDWQVYFNIPAYFVTYFGEVYFGTIWQLADYPDRFFIVQNDKLNTIRGLKSEDKTLENYRQLGREITDVRVIAMKPFTSLTGQRVDFGGVRYGDGQQFKRLFVFGAAASSFCVYGKDSRSFRRLPLNPPCGYEVFDEKYDEIAKKYPGVQSSLPLFQAKNKSIEECLKEEWQVFSSSYNPEVACNHINIQFYLQELFQAVSKEVVQNHARYNLYSVFLGKIRKHVSAYPHEKVSMVSFNYDVILDGFIREVFGYHYLKMQDYINWNNKSVLLFKPHGSCNWGWRFDKNKIKLKDKKITEALYDEKTEPWKIYFDLLGNMNQMISLNTWGHESGFDKYGRGRFTMNKNLLEIIPSISGEYYFPSLLLPYRDKDDVAMPYDHYYALNNGVLPNIQELYLIGWKGNEDVFNRQLKAAVNLKKIFIVNPKAYEVQHNLSKHLDLKKYEVVVVKDFEDFVLNRVDGILG